MKTKITLTDSRLSVAEFTQLISNSVSLVDQKSPSFGSDEMVEALFNRIKKQLPDLESTIKQKRGSDLTGSIQRLMRARNLDITALFDSIKPYKVSRVKEKVEAYHSLHSLFAKYRDICRKTSEVSPALVKSLLSKLAQDGIEAQVTLLGITDHVNNLKESHNAFNAAYLKRKQEMSEKVLLDSGKLRKMIGSDYKLLYNCLLNKIAYNPKADEKDLLNLLNEVRQDYAELLNRRKTQGLKKQKLEKEQGEEDKKDEVKDENQLETTS